MNPLTSESQDTIALCDLGRASVQIVHDLKNQLNGLKLYATFLRKRLERAERPADELETIAKLIAGLERAARETTIMVRYGRPLELRLTPRVDVAKIVTTAVTGEDLIEIEDGSYEGDFDAAALAEALQNIASGVRTIRVGTAGAPNEFRIRLSKRAEPGEVPTAVIEWNGIASDKADGLLHSFAGGDALRMALAAKIIRAHGGEVAHETGTLRVCLPLKRQMLDVRCQSEITNI